MVTPIKNKAYEVREWIKRVHADDGEVGEIDVRAYVRKRWPDLDSTLQSSIVYEVMK